MIAPIRKLPTNAFGKDYVVGDLHGCFDLLQRLLNDIQFDINHDRLFSVGDLIDRGPDSLKCLELVNEPWFYAVRGNHEIIALDFFESYLMTGRLESLQDINYTGFLEYGGEWVDQYFLAAEQRMTPEFDRGLSMIGTLPLILVVGDGEKRFHIIHAELSSKGQKTSESPVWLNTEVDVWLDENRVPPRVEDRLIWSRTLMSSQYVKQPNSRLQSGLSPTFCGHTYESRPRQALSHICIDTGAFASIESADDIDTDFGLTVFDVKASSWISASYCREHFVRGKLSLNNQRIALTKRKN
ncbi:MULTISPECIES: metallophosphoesterase [Methylomonas]|uniref:Serine/threonine specific protein phosphatases domain-containing protein n=2 Tax=Methylomonas TaxID=416 RepID=A0A126T389_9GAMM|nr:MULTISPECIES: metallophosphoesterase [Methylomonas]AMK76539.1 hypothetical protein JT25_008550 [Methylomonas denitrificans]OAI08130.1 hypothetical protein A1342_19685 [Methylomonas methanica]TCV88578.1 serine/threonine protein phosphatase 1 [Methylomonas methanica]